MGFVILLMLGQTLDFPAEFKGDPGQFIAIKPNKTEGKVVQYYAIDSGLNVFPASLLSDPTATVVTSVAPGVYRLLAWTAVADKPSPASLIRVNIQGPQPPSPPAPPKPTDTLQEEIASMWGAILEQDKNASKSSLISAYKQCSLTANRQFKTLGDLYEALAIDTAKVGKDKLMPIRKRVASEIEKIVGSDPEAAYLEGQRLALSSLFSRISAILEDLK